MKPEFVTGIADQHAKIIIEPSGKATVTNLSGQDSSVKLKSGASEVFVTAAPVQLQHGDVLTICTRSFRFEEISKRKALDLVPIIFFFVLTLILPSFSVNVALSSFFEDLIS